jgi:site-specific DNA recombinase
MIKVAGYGRVSTAGQVKDGTSLEDQRKAIKNKTYKEGYKLVDCYFDEGISGGSLDRPALLKLRKDAKDGKFEAILFTKLDRMGRSVRDIHNLWHELKTELGIDLICIDDPSINTTGRMGSVMLGILSSFAQFERDMIKERTQEGRQAKWRKGELPIGDQFLPFGYKKDEAGKPEIVPKHADIYQKIVGYYLDEKLNTKQIAIRLTKEGIETPSALRGKKLNSTRWNSVSIGSILKHPGYKGEAVFNCNIFGKQQGRNYIHSIGKRPEEEWIHIKLPALITDTRWQEIQDRIKTQKHMPKRKYKGYEDHFLLDGLIYCYECGSRMKKKVKMEKDGKARLYYSCYWQACSQTELEMAGRSKCTMKSTDADNIDRELFNKLINLLSNPDEFAQTWFKDMDSEALQEKNVSLRKQDKKLLDELKEGYRFISKQTNAELKEMHWVEYKKTQIAWEELQSELKRTVSELDAIENKIDRFNEFKKAMNKGSTRDQFKKRFATEVEFSRFMLNLPFSEKRRVVEVCN